MNKKIIASLLVSGMLLAGSVNSVSATSVNQSTNWVSQTIGKSYDFDGAYGYQCFDYVNQYAHDLFGTSFSGGGAIDLLNTGNKNGFKVIRAGNSTPQPGDIFILSTPGNPYGHTGIVISSDSTGMMVADQNYAGRGYVSQHRINYHESWSDLVGWIRPPFDGNNGGSTTPTSGIHVGDTVAFKGVYKVTNTQGNLVGSSQISGGGVESQNYIDPTPLYETDAQGNLAGDQVLLIGDYFVLPGSYKVEKVDAASNGVYVIVGGRGVWLDGGQTTINGNTPVPVAGGWRTENGQQVFINTDGQYASGEKNIDGQWYYFDPSSHAMAKGFITLADGRKVYYDESGHMVKGQAFIGGFWYVFDNNDGNMKTGFQDLTSYGDSKTCYYEASTGHMLYGQQVIDGKTYNFDANTGAMSNNTQQPQRDIQVGDTVAFKGVYKVTNVNGNLVGSSQISGGGVESWNYLDPTPLTETDQNGNTAGDQVLLVGDYFVMPGSYKVEKIDKASNGVYVTVGGRGVWLDGAVASLQ